MTGIHAWVENPSVVEMYVFRGVFVCLWSNIIKTVCIQISVFSIIECPTRSSLCFWTYNITHSLSLRVDWNIYFGGSFYRPRWRPITNIRISSITTFCLWYGTVRRVLIQMKEHVYGFIKMTAFGYLVASSSSVVAFVSASFVSFYCNLLCFIDYSYHFWINGSGII